MEKKTLKPNTPKQRYLHYCNRLDESFTLEKEAMCENFIKCLDIAEEIEFQRFGSNPFAGSCENLIFLTYSDHAHGNAGVRQSICELHQQHSYADDRGYIKGIALDLKNYVKLRQISRLFNRCTNEDCFLRISQYIRPAFKNTAKNDVLRQKANEKEKDLKKQLLDIHTIHRQRLNEFLKEKTGISALYYLREI